MRKLILTSFKARTGVEPFYEQRLVIIDSGRNDSVDDDREQAAEVFKKWFAMAYPQSKLISVIPHETVQLLEDHGMPDKPAPVFDAWNISGDNPKRKRLHNGDLSRLSETVIIDVNGNKDCYAIGCFDFDTNQWRLDNKEKVSLLTRDMKWRTI